VFFNRVDDLSRPFLSMLNVRFAFAHESVQPPPGWRVVAKQRQAVLLENTNALERAFVPPTVSLGGSVADIADFRERASIEVDGQPYERANGPGRVTIRRARQGYALDADMQRDGWIVVTNSDWKGWRAYIDGRRVKTHRANGAFLGIYTPAGRHRVRLTYWPGSFVVGRGVTLGALLGIFVFGVIGRRKGSEAQRLKASAENSLSL